MAYDGKTNWQNNEIVDAADMNRIEQGILDNDKLLYLVKTIFPTISSSNVFTVAISSEIISSMSDLIGVPLKIKADANSSSAVSLQINSFSAYSLKKSNGNDVTNLKANGIYTVVWDGVNFQLLGEGGEYGSVTPADVLLNVPFGTEDGIKLGTIPTKGAATYNPSQSDQIITSGQYLSGNQTIKAVTFDASKVLNDTTIAGKKGTIPQKGAQTYTPSTSNQTIASGQYLSGTQTIAGDADLISANIKAGKNIFGVAGDANVVDTSDGTATASQILSGKVAYVDGAKITGTIPSKTAQTYTPKTTNQTIASGQYLSGTQTIKGDANLVPANIKKGVSIFGVAGSLVIIPYTAEWTQRTSSFSGTAIYGVTYGNNMFVAVGGSGKLATSTNGTTWTQRTSSFDSTAIQSVTYGNNIFVAVGDHGKLATSTDGITWVQRTSSFSGTAIYGVAYGNNIFVAVGDYGKLATSTNGTTWVQRTSSFDNKRHINSVFYGDGMFVAVGDYGQLATLS